MSIETKDQAIKKAREASKVIMQDELERKWVLTSPLPKHITKNALSVNIWQGYFNVSSGSLHVRSVDDKNFFLTSKMSGISTKEIERAITLFEFQQFQSMVCTRNLCKKRFYVSHTIRIAKNTDQIVTLVIDFFKERLSGLAILECEFTSRKHWNKFILPSWVHGAIEVTENKLFSNSNLSKPEFTAESVQALFGQKILHPRRRQSRMQK